MTNLELTFDTIKEKYQQLFDELIDQIEIDNKLVKNALKEQIPLQLQWELLHKEIANLYNLVETKVEESYNEAVADELSDGYRKMTYSEAKSYAFADQDYKEAKALLIEVQRIRDEIKGILETIHSRKYILNNLSNLIVAGSQDQIL